MFQVGDLVKDKENFTLSRVAMITRVDSRTREYEYYMLSDPYNDWRIDIDTANSICHVVQR